MPEDAFEEWQIYATLEPFGPAVEDLHNAMIMAALYEPHRDSKKRSKPFTSDDFRLGHVIRKKPAKLPPGVVLAKMKAIFGPPTQCQTLQ